MGDQRRVAAIDLEDVGVGIASASARCRLVRMALSRKVITTDVGTSMSPTQSELSKVPSALSAFIVVLRLVMRSSFSAQRRNSGPSR